MALDDKTLTKTLTTAEKLVALIKTLNTAEELVALDNKTLTTAEKLVALDDKTLTTAEELVVSELDKTLTSAGAEELVALNRQNTEPELSACQTETQGGHHQLRYEPDFSAKNT